MSSKLEILRKNKTKLSNKLNLPVQNIEDQNWMVVLKKLKETERKKKNK